MQQRTLGKTGWQVSAISMGCWGIGGQWGPVAANEAIRTIHTAIDCGVNLLDTADAYGLGVSEELVGEAIRDRRGAPVRRSPTTRRTTSTSAATRVSGG